MAHSPTRFAATLGWLNVPGALAEVGLPPLSIPMALPFINVGGEIGQRIFSGVVLGTIAVARRIARRLKFDAPSGWWHVPPHAFGGIGSFRVVQRVAAFRAAGSASVWVPVAVTTARMRPAVMDEPGNCGAGTLGR